MSSYRARLERLRRRFADKSQSTCANCGGPRPGYSQSLWLDKSGTHRWGYCPACGLALDAQGRAWLALRHIESGPAPLPKAYGWSAPLDSI